ncbi:MAG: hypothetical protein ACREYE_09460 [Gammaproteobacteria bacterium]
MTSGNGWDEMKRVVTSSLDRHEIQLKEINATLKELLVAQARLDERVNRRAVMAGALSGALAGLTSWFK